MSICQKLGKDKLILVTKEDHEKPCNIELKELDTRFQEHGFVKPDGQLNWNCPCLGTMAAGPCGYAFREAFGCFHYSTSEPKGNECYDKFAAMNACFAKYPKLYPTSDKNESAMNKISDDLAKN